MKLEICSLRTHNYDYYLQEAERLGYTPTEQDGKFYIDILNEPSYWRSPSAEFKTIPSGIYVFKEEKSL